MDNQKNSNGIIALFSIIVVLLLTFIILLSTGVITFKGSSQSSNQQDCGTTNNSNNDNGSNNENNSGNVVDNNSNCECKCDSKPDFKLDEAKLKDLCGSATINSLILEHFDPNTSVRLLTDGRISIGAEHFISNISNAKDMLLLTPPGPVSTLYILTEDGFVYKYSSEEYETGNYQATKVEGYSNIKYITKYLTNKINAGGTTFIVAIDADDNYYKLDEFSV